MPPRPMRLSLFALALLLAGPAASAQTPPLLPGTGFIWEAVGDRPYSTYQDLAFDAGGTLWTTEDVRWLDPVTGTWIEPETRGLDTVLPLGLHPSDGPARADTVLAIGYFSYDGAETMTRYDDDYFSMNVGEALVEIPAGFPHAGRVLVGRARGYSDDRGATWTAAQDVGPAAEARIGAYSLLPLPPAGRLPGSTSGRDPAAPATWPAARVVAGGDGGVSLSDDSGETYHVTTWGGGELGFETFALAVVRRPDAHPLGPGPRLLMGVRISGIPDRMIWSSDDAGETWTERARIPENESGAGASKVRGVFALSEPGETDPGAGGRALTVLGRGHVYHTADGGDTWTLLGRAPNMWLSDPDDPTRPITSVGAAELGPDGRLYVGVKALGTDEEWVYRTASPIAVADEAAPSAPDLGVTVSPNPSSGRVTVSVARPSAGAVRVEVVDAVGRRVARLYDGAAHGDLSLSVDTAAWAPGVYVVRVRTDDGIAARSVTVAR